jgi:hypothetical protein
MHQYNAEHYTNVMESMWSQRELVCYYIGRIFKISCYPKNGLIFESISAEKRGLFDFFDKTGRHTCDKTIVLNITVDDGIAGDNDVLINRYAVDN